MKRLITNKIPHYELEIVAVLAKFEELPIAAAQHIVNLEPRNMKEAYQLTDEEYSIYLNFLRTVASIIVNSGFEITDEYQSPDSLSYYIQFTPTFYDGILENDVDKSIPRRSGTDFVLDVKFRLSDHYVTGEPNIADSLGRTKSHGVAFKEFVVAGFKHDTINTVINDVKQICEDLKVGDYSRVIPTLNTDL